MDPKSERAQKMLRLDYVAELVESVEVHQNKWAKDAETVLHELVQASKNGEIKLLDATNVIKGACSTKMLGGINKGLYWILEELKKQ